MWDLLLLNCKCTTQVTLSMCACVPGRAMQNSVDCDGANRSKLLHLLLKMLRYTRFHVVLRNVPSYICNVLWPTSRRFCWFELKNRIKLVHQCLMSLLITSVILYCQPVWGFVDLNLMNRSILVHHYVVLKYTYILYTMCYSVCVLNLFQTSSRVSWSKWIKLWGK